MVFFKVIKKFYRLEIDEKINYRYILSASRSESETLIQVGEKATMLLLYSKKEASSFFSKRHEGLDTTMHLESLDAFYFKIAL